MKRFLSVCCVLIALSACKKDETPSDASTTDVSRDTAVADADTTPRAIWIGVGNHFMCALGSDGMVYCLGHNEEVGLDSDTATPISGLSGVTQMSASGDNICVRLSSGAVKCWGNNNS